MVKLQRMESPRGPYVRHTLRGRKWCSSPESKVLGLTHLLLRISSAYVRNGVDVLRGSQHRGTSPYRGVVTAKSLPGEGGAKGKLRGHPDQEVTRPKLASITFKYGGMGMTLNS